MNSKLKAMVVDDHPIHQTIIKQYLTSRGVNTATFGNVTEALSSLEGNTYNIIFCDLQMPGKDGIDMMLLLNKHGYSGSVVLVSAMDDTIISSLTCMCRPFTFNVIGKLAKPYFEDDIDKLIACVCDKHQSKASFPKQIEVDEQEFLLALAEGRVKNYYQPIVDTKSGALVGYEALARWMHPIYGLLLPYVFLPIVEKCGLSPELFDTVFNNAIQDIKLHGIKHSISLNVAQDNLEDALFSERFLTRCDENNIDPKTFTIEITERESYSSNVNLYKNLLKLRLNGVSVSIDDFGTGSSSLEKLSQLPFNELKIDRSFIQGITSEQKDKNIVRSICGLAKSLNISIVAEGVEDEETFSLLDEYGINLAQGYFIDKPMPLEAITVLNKEKKYV